MKNVIRILVVEDEVNLARGLMYNLEVEGYRVILATDGQQAIDLVNQSEFDLVILDIILPILDGYAVLKEIRRLYLRLPVIILTAKLEEGDRVLGLELGADDYLTKPFHLKELLLRIKGMLRRSGWYEEPKASEEYSFGSNKINFKSLKASGPTGGRDLTAKEAHLLQVLIENEGEALSREKLLEEVWGYPPDMVTRTVDAFISRLRSYFEVNPKQPKHILSLRGLGYRFVRDPE